MKCNDFSPSNGHSALLHSGSKCAGRSRASHFDAGWSSPVARQAHNLKVVGSNPTPATKHAAQSKDLAAFFYAYRAANSLVPAPLIAYSKYELFMFDLFGLCLA